MEVSVTKGPHLSGLEYDTISQIQFEAREKVAQGFETIVSRDDI